MQSISLQPEGIMSLGNTAICYITITMLSSHRAYYKELSNALSL